MNVHERATIKIEAQGKGGKTEPTAKAGVKVEDYRAGSDFYAGGNP